MEEIINEVDKCDKSLEELSLVEKKSLAYDTLSQIEMLQRNLQIINQAINIEINNMKK